MDDSDPRSPRSDLDRAPLAGEPDDVAVDVGPAADRGECEQYAAVVTEALQFPRLSEQDWLSRYDPADIWVARARGRVVAGAVLLRAGQWLGGRCVPMIGVHAVGVVPELRGRGVGGALMRAVVRAMRAAGAPISVLYPATQPVYRGVGFELAGSRTLYAVRTASIDSRDRALPVERLGPPGTPEHERLFGEVADTYRAFARAQSGLVERGPFLWRRIVDPMIGSASAFAVRQDGRITGYVVIAHVKHAARPYYDLRCPDLVALTPEAGRRLLALLADHRSMSPRVLLAGPPGLGQLLPLADAEVEVDWYLRWMVRVLDVAGALEARGYAPQVSARLSLAVRDELCPDNAGVYALSVADGRGRVTRQDGDGDAGADVALDVRGLASLYTGFATAAELSWTGLAAGEPEALARASAVFAGPPPWIPEVF